MQYAEDRIAAGSSAGSRGATWDCWVRHEEANTDPDKHRSRSQDEDRVEHAAMLCLGQGPEAPLNALRTRRMIAPARALPSLRLATYTSLRTSKVARGRLLPALAGVTSSASPRQ